jgi:predicted DNA-binding transcriptional regulator YafY
MLFYSSISANRPSIGSCVLKFLVLDQKRITINSCVHWRDIEHRKSDGGEAVTLTYSICDFDVRELLAYGRGTATATVRERLNTQAKNALNTRKPRPALQPGLCAYSAAF